MPEKTGPNLGMSYGWDEGEDGWKPGTDKNYTRVDGLLGLEVLDADLSTPPVSPSEGDRYIVGPAATGAWLGQEDSIAIYLEGTWTFYPPTPGLRAFVGPDRVIARYDGGAALWLRGDESIRVVTDSNALQGLIGYASGVTPGLFLVRSLDGQYNPQDAGLLLGDGLLQLHGGQIQIPGLTHTEAEGLPLMVSPDGNLYLGPKLPSTWTQTDSDIGDYDLGTGTGTGAWVEMTGLQILLAQNIEIGDVMQATVSLYIAEKSGNRSGTVEVYLDEAGAAPGGGVTPSASVYVSPGMAQLVTLGVQDTAAVQRLAGATVTVYARIAAGSNPQYGVDLTGSVEPHVYVLSKIS